MTHNTRYVIARMINTHGECDYLSAMGGPWHTSCRSRRRAMTFDSRESAEAAQEWLYVRLPKWPCGSIIKWLIEPEREASRAA